MKYQVTVQIYLHKKKVKCLSIFLWESTINPEFMKSGIPIKNTCPPDIQSIIISFVGNENREGLLSVERYELLLDSNKQL